jgi:hypothetical protein
MAFILVVCRLPLRPSMTCCPVGGQAIWPGDMVHTGSKRKTDINDGTQHVETLDIKLNSNITLKIVLALWRNFFV